MLISWCIYPTTIRAFAVNHKTSHYMTLFYSLIIIYTHNVIYDLSGGGYFYSRKRFTRFGFSNILTRASLKRIDCRNAHPMQKHLYRLCYYYDWDDDSASGLIVPEGITIPRASISILTWKYECCVIEIC